MSIYLDVILLKELLIDTVLLLITAWVRRFKPSRWRVIAGALVGSLYTLGMLFPSLSFLFHFMIKIFVSLLMIFIVFGFHSLQQFLKDTLTFYVVSFVAAGSVMGLYFMFMNSANEMWRHILLSGGQLQTTMQISVFYLVACFLIGLYMFKGVLRSKQKQQLVTDHLAQVEFRIKDDEFSCTGLMDTGNHLYDPLTNTPVMVIEAGILRSHLPEAFIHALQKGQIDQAMNYFTEDEHEMPWREKIRIIPYRAVNRDSQFLLAVKPDYVSIHYGGKSFSTSKVLIGFDGGKMSADSSYQAILHLSMLQG